MAKGQPANRAGRAANPEVIPDDEVVGEGIPENTSETDLPPAGGTVVSAPPAPAARPAPSAARPDPPLEESQEIEQPNPAATRILDIDTLEAPARFELVVTEGRSRGTRFPLRVGVHTVGRSGQCDCSVLDEAVSRRHFELTVDAQGVTVRDLGSGNGTLLNGEKTDESQVEHGDLLRIGDSALELRERGRPPVSHARPGTAAPGREGASPSRAAPAKAGLTANQRKLLLGVLAVFTLTILFAALAKVRAHNSAIHDSTLAFERGRRDLEQGDADAALDEFQRALIAYPDPGIVQEKIAIARVLSDGTKALGRARDLIDQKDFDGARRILDGVPHTDLLDGQVKDAKAELDKRVAEAQKQRDLAVEAGRPIDPTTLAEADAIRDRAQKEAHGDLEAAAADMGRAYQMLASRGAGGPNFEQLRASYLDLLKQLFQRYRRTNPSKAALAIERANAVLPDSIRPDEIDAAPAPAAVFSAPHPGGKHKRPRPHVRHHATAHLPHRQSIAKAPGGGRHYDEGRAEELDDEGDALLGQDPDAAKRKYEEAIKFAPPGSEAAQHAQQGLNP